MKTASPTLIAHLNAGNQFIMADLYTLTLVGGTVIRFTTWDTALVMGGNTFAMWSVERSRTRVTVGLEVDTLDLTITPTATTLVNGVAFLPAVLRGALDGAALMLQRVFMPSPGDTSLGGILLFSGKVSTADVDRFGAKITVKSELELLDIQIPRNTFQSGCGNTLFDQACGVNKAGQAVAGVVTAATLADISTALVGDLTLGLIRFDSGVNAGVSRSVRQHSSGRVYFAVPLVSACAVGDAFTAWPGCDKTLATCESRFANRANFRGYPFIPVPETIL